MAGSFGLGAEDPAKFDDLMARSSVLGAEDSTKFDDLMAESSGLVVFTTEVGLHATELREGLTVAERTAVGAAVPSTHLMPARTFAATAVVGNAMGTVGHSPDTAAVKCTDGTG